VSRIDLSSVVSLFLERPAGEESELGLSRALAALLDALFVTAPGIIREQATAAPAWQVLFFGGQRPEEWRVGSQILPPPASPFARPDASAPTGTLDLLAWLAPPNGALGHLTRWRTDRTSIEPGAISGPHEIVAYNLHLVLVESLAVRESALGARLLRELAPPRRWSSWRAAARDRMGSGPVPSLPEDDDLLEALRKDRERTRGRARAEIAEAFDELRRAFAAHDPKLRAELVAAAQSTGRPRWTSVHHRRHNPRRLCPERLPGEPPLTADMLLASVLARIILERRYEARASAALPMELVARDGHALVSAEQLDSTRSVKHRVRELAKRALERELFGTGISSPASERQVLSLDAEPLEGEATIADTCGADDPALAEVEVQLDRASLRANLGTAQRQAVDLYLEAERHGISLRVVCERHDVGYELTRKRLQRLRRDLRENSPTMSQPGLLARPVA